MSVRKGVERLHQIWRMSYPHDKKSRAEDFRDKAKAEGYTDEQIDFFLKLCRQMWRSLNQQ